MRKKFLLAAISIVIMFAMAVPSYADFLRVFEFSYATGGAQYTNALRKT